MIDMLNFYFSVIIDWIWPMIWIGALVVYIVFQIQWLRGKVNIKFEKEENNGQARHDK